MRRVVVSFAAVAILCVGLLTGVGPGLNEAGAATCPTAGRFAVSGIRILDPNCQSFYMKGLNRVFSGFGDDIINQAEFHHMKADWHANAVRIFVSERFWLGSEPTLSDGSANPNYCPQYANFVTDPSTNPPTTMSYTAMIAQEIQWAHADGLLSMITLGDTSRTGKLPCWTSAQMKAQGNAVVDGESVIPTNGPGPDATFSSQFWTEVASTFAGYGDVAFELFNEPQCLTDTVWHDGGTQPKQYDSRGSQLHCETNTSAVTTPMAGFQNLYNSVRSVAPSNIVMVPGKRQLTSYTYNVLGQPTEHNPGTSGAYDVTVALRRPITGHDIAYSTHIYLGAKCGSKLPADIDTVVKQTSAQIPVEVSEFGSDCYKADPLSPGTKQGTENNQAIINYLHQTATAVNGYAAFDWEKKYTYSCDAGTCYSFGLYAASAQGQPVYTSPSEMGIPIWNDRNP